LVVSQRPRTLTGVRVLTERRVSMSFNPTTAVDTSCLQLPPEFEAKYAEIGKAVLLNAFIQAIQGKRDAYEDLELRVPVTVMIGLKQMVSQEDSVPPPVALEPCGVGGEINHFWCVTVFGFGQVCFF
jgi:hypothetical protein